ncbi:branched-chain amino acid aminotransferase [Sinorhizobium alkalisoli]|uniref:Branched-chain-amino-acid aminotransferase n=1 Tax=Sinorhizobium alkalisoli TaxID=1752398 RepID=A0A1E3V982_9HYPH|nr:branched-chain amino acid aminotransferase [Sinorhizobium alkalisoli]MCG5479959.1 branched-chain amino acid aminotransferase [Sinorhizobium alkalisoli]ODR90194.1 branched-chain amino acid aminotransferase [Sinorhizobium alkalisoli]QFI68316.1 Branched-chain amino acid aminotransferase [Sinorhizobium alkalisoli]
MTESDAKTFLFEKNPNPLAASERETILQNPGFGRVFTDHMVTVRYSEGRGWHGGRIEARKAFDLDPATVVFHYAQEIFEGMKAYRLPDGGAALFRPDANARRFRNSALRLAMAPLPEEMFVESVRELVRVDRDWIPSADGSALYLRPFMIATEVLLGVKPSAEYIYCVIASSVGSYFKGGAPAVTLWVSENYTRAAPGGTGEAKCGGNYAASLAAQAEATREGCEQVIFLDAVERRFVEELGGMNVFFVFNDGSLQTPPLTGTILPGITRDSLITLARDRGLTVREEPYAIEQWQADAQSGRLTEAFACGTAAVVTPIGRVKGRKHSFTIGDGGAGPVAGKLKAALLDIQNGRAPDPHGWVDRLF